MISAAVHFVLFRWLDGKRTTDTISQTYVATISTAIVTAFRILLGCALLVSLTQLLWQKFRARVLKVSTIDALLSINFDPSSLADVDVLLNAPLLCLCAVLYWCLPLAMIYPPGALVLESRPFQHSVHMTVPSFDPGYQGEATLKDMMQNTLFRFDPYLNYEQVVICELIMGLSERLTIRVERLSLASHVSESKQSSPATIKLLNHRVGRIAPLHLK